VKLFSRSSATKALSLAAVSALVLSGCATAPEPDPTAEPIDFLACAVSDEGTFNDKSFNESAIIALNQAKSELGVQIKTAESLSPEDYEPNLQVMVDEGCDIIFGIGYNLVADINKVAAANPTVNFGIIDGWSEGNNNLKPYDYATAQASFLAGYAAASYSKTKVIATFGGDKIPSVTVFMDGYVNGAQLWAEENNTPVEVIGWDVDTQLGDFTGNFDANSPESKTISLTHLNAGADVLFPVGGNQFSAVATAIEESGVEAVMVGVDLDIAANNSDLAKYVLTSVEKRMSKNIFDTIKALVEGEAFVGGDAGYYFGTLENGGIQISPFYDFEAEIESATLTRIAELQAEIIAGTRDPLS
jgi:basic membrane protein A and related proteins